jgi:DNA-binding response OmpR family regulator
MFEDGLTATQLRFGIFEVDLDARELPRAGIKIRIQPQSFEILAILVLRSGQIVTREELRQRLWPPDTFVDFEHSLNAAVKRLRLALMTPTPRGISKPFLDRAIA